MKPGLADRLKPPSYWWMVEETIAWRMQRKLGLVDWGWVRHQVEVQREKYAMRISAAMMV